jgi:hypothetical protein
MQRDPALRGSTSTRCCMPQVWDEVTGLQTSQVKKLTAGLNVLDLNIPAGCSPVCTTSVMLFWPRQTASPLPPTIPLSPGFDPMAPALVKLTDYSDYQVPLDEEMASLEVGITVNSGPAGGSEVIAAPFSDVTVMLDVKQCGGTACTPPQGDLEACTPCLVSIPAFRADACCLIASSCVAFSCLCTVACASHSGHTRACLCL